MWMFNCPVKFKPNKTVLSTMLDEKRAHGPAVGTKKPTTSKLEDIFILTVGIVKRQKLYFLIR